MEGDGHIIAKNYNNNKLKLIQAMGENEMKQQQQQQQTQTTRPGARPSPLSGSLSLVFIRPFSQQLDHECARACASTAQARTRLAHLTCGLNL